MSTAYRTWAILRYWEAKPLFGGGVCSNPAGFKAAVMGPIARARFSKRQGEVITERWRPQTDKDHLRVEVVVEEPTIAIGQALQGEHIVIKSRVVPIQSSVAARNCCENPVNHLLNERFITAADESTQNSEPRPPRLLWSDLILRKPPHLLRTGVLPMVASVGPLGFSRVPARPQ